jgi:hypothetical protein
MEEGSGACGRIVIDMPHALVVVLHETVTRTRATGPPFCLFDILQPRAEFVRQSVRTRKKDERDSLHAHVNLRYSGEHRQLVTLPSSPGLHSELYRGCRLLKGPLARSLRVLRQARRMGNVSASVGLPRWRRAPPSRPTVWNKKDDEPDIPKRAACSTDAPHTGRDPHAARGLGVVLREKFCS